MNISMWFRPLAVAAAMCLVAGPASAQEPKVWAYLDFAAKDVKDSISNPPGLPLRANASQRLVVRVVNPTDSTPSVSVEVRVGDKVVAKMANPVNVKAAVGTQWGIQVVPLVPGDVADGIMLDRDFTFQVVVKRGDTETVSSQTVTLQEARDLLDVDATYFGTGKSLKVDVKFNKSVVVDKETPPLPVELVIESDLIPGLKDKKFKKALAGSLTPDGKEVKLSATGLNIAPTKGADGKAGDRIALNVDGLPRALQLYADFDANNNGTKKFTLVEEKGLRIIADRAVVSGAKVPVTVQAFKISDKDDLTLEFGQQIDGEERQNRVFKNLGPRVQTAKAKVDNKGLLVTTTLADWKVELDTAGIAHKCILRAKAGDAVATHEFIVDATGPEVSKLGLLKKDETPNTSQSVAVVATASDPDSDIEKVEFFLGSLPEAGKDGKYPAGTVVYKGKPGKDDQWTADVTLPEKPGPVTIYVRGFNKVGMANEAEFDLAVTKAAAAGQLGSIKGKVTEGPVGQKATAFKEGLTVSLFKKDDPADKGKATTLNKEGIFEFKNLAPAEYVVYTEKVVGNATKTGQQTVKVEAKKDPVEVTLKLMQPRATIVNK